MKKVSYGSLWSGSKTAVAQQASKEVETSLVSDFSPLYFYYANVFLWACLYFTLLNFYHENVCLSFCAVTLAYYGALWESLIVSWAKGTIGQGFQKLFFEIAILGPKIATFGVTHVEICDEKSSLFRQIWLWNRHFLPNFRPKLPLFAIFKPSFGQIWWIRRYILLSSCNLKKR